MNGIAVFAIQRGDLRNFFKGENMIENDLLGLAAGQIGGNLVNAEMRHFADEKIGFLFHGQSGEIAALELIGKIAGEEDSLALCFHQIRLGGTIGMLQMPGRHSGDADIFIFIDQTGLYQMEGKAFMIQGNALRGHDQATKIINPRLFS